ncbi:retrovirus-related pol polyprotein from transposon TNT 1-94 [Tanacetum coccineum]|uniref:Retrovirus-related pol polyprotein from transposon TNT 1-94 n=1 Tax=Tanacetum coccineum TaxID=301880 RepID=A0ABQ4WWE1_9ASTR
MDGSQMYTSRTRGEVQQGSVRARVLKDLSAEEKERYKADIRATNILLQGHNSTVNVQDQSDFIFRLLQGQEATKQAQRVEQYSMKNVVVSQGEQVTNMMMTRMIHRRNDLALNVNHIFSEAIITPSGLTEGERGFEQTKRCYLTEVIPFFKTLKEHFVGVQTALFTEVKVMEEIFDQMNNEVDKNLIEKKNLLIENENLIVNCLSTQLLYDVAKSRCLDLEADVSKVHDESKLISKIEREYLNLQLKYQHLQESFDNKNSQASPEAPDFRSFFKIKNLEHQIQEKDNVIGHLKDIVTNVKARSREPYSAVDVTALTEQNNCDRLELEKVKQHYKELFDSIKILRTHTSEKTSTMLNEIESLKAQLRSKAPCFTSDCVKPKVLAPGMYAIDVKPIPHPLKNNRSAHLNYIGHLKESVETVREIVEEARVVKPLDSSLNYACRYTKLSQELLECVIGTCPKSFNERDNKAPSTPVTRKKQVTFSDKPGTSSSNTQKHKVHQRVQLTNIPVLPSTGVNDSTEASGSKPRSNTKKNRILPAKKENKKEVEVRLRTNKSVWTKVNRVDSSISSKRVNSVDKQCAEIEKKNLLIENENLIVNCLSTQLLYDVAKSRCLDLEADMSKVHDESKLISKLEREYLNLQLKYQHLQESFDNKKSQASQEAPDFNSFFKIKNLEHQIQEKDNVIRHLKDLVANVNDRSREPYNAIDVTALIEQNDCDRVELEKVKQHYKELYDSIKIMRAHTSEKTSTMLNEIESLKAQLRSKEPCFTSDYVKPRVLAPGMYAIDVKPIPHPLKNNRSAHLNYINHLKESVETVREIVEEARVVKPLDSSLNYACRYTKLSQELLECVIGTCPKSFNERDNKAPSTPVTRKKQVTFRVNDSTEASGSNPRSNTKKNRILPAKKENKKEVEVRLRTNKSVWTKVNRVDSSISSKRVVINSNSESVCKTCNKCVNSASHEMCVVNILNSVNATSTIKIVLNKGKQIWKPKGRLSDTSLYKTKRVWKATGKLFTDIGYQWRTTRKKLALGKLDCGSQWRPTGKKFALGEMCHLTKLSVKCSTLNANQQVMIWYLDSGCSKHMTGNRSKLMNFVEKFIGSVRFGNDHLGAIMGYGDYVMGDSVISRVYYVEGLGHNLFSVGQFCDSDLEVAFRKHTCFVRDIKGTDILKGSRGTNLYTISIDEMMKSSPICLLSKASKSKSWLWHRRLNHLNFGTINDLARKDLVRGLPRLKFEKDHLCSACQLGKSKKFSHRPKSENTNMEVLHTLHMDLCGPMRVQSIKGKKYILVIVDDYSRFTWVKFLRSKDETPEFVTNFLKQIQVGLNKTVRFIRTDNGTEFVNQVMSEYYEGVGIFHQKSVPRTPQQNGVVERRNRTLVEAARTMMIFSKAPMFLWAEAVATACYTQNRSLIHTRHNKTPYELVHDKKPDLTFFRVFGALCYPTNDSENLGKFQAKADIGIFVGYAPSRKGYRIYNKRTRRLMETIHVTFDEMHQSMAPVRISSGPEPVIVTPGQLKSGLAPTDKELEVIGSTSRGTRRCNGYNSSVTFVEMA